MILHLTNNRAYNIIITTTIIIDYKWSIWKDQGRKVGMKCTRSSMTKYKKLWTESKKKALTKTSPIAIVTSGWRVEVEESLIRREDDKNWEKQHFLFLTLPLLFNHPHICVWWQPFWPCLHGTKWFTAAFSLTQREWEDYSLRDCSLWEPLKHS